MPHGPFYGKKIVRREERKYIEYVLQEFRHLPPTKELQQAIWERLQKEKSLGRISIPFQVFLRKEEPPHIPAYVEILLDTKV